MMPARPVTWFNLLTSRFRRYWQDNWKWVGLSVLIGLGLAFWIFPWLLTPRWIRASFALRSCPTFYLLVAISYFFVFLCYRPLVRLWPRYKNNFKLQRIPFTYIDGLLFSLITLIPSVFFGKILQGTRFSKEVTAWGIALGISVLILLFKVISAKSQAPIHCEEKPSNEDFFPDEPITHKNQDLLDRKEFVKDLYSQITNYPFPDGFVFGLYGEWGEGKTSAINLLKNELYENKAFMVYEFDPWHFSSQDVVLKSFYEGLYSALNRTFFLPNIKRSFVKYQRFLSSGLKLAGFSLDIELCESLEETRERIQGWISSTGRKIVVIVDDLDRLQSKDWVLEIFKIVKLSGRFKNVIYLLSFDPKRISLILGEDDRSFLEKIMQSPITLPAADQAMIDKFLFWSSPAEGHFSAIDRLFRKLEISEDRVKDFDKGFIYLYESQIKRLFRTLRQAKRYLNGLYSTLPTVKNEVNLQDFLILELIRVFYPDVYKDIWQSPWYYIPLAWSHRTVAWPRSFLDEKERLKEIKEHITKIAGDDEVLIALLKAIFFVIVAEAFGTRTDHSSPEACRVAKNITHPDVFPKYFMLRVPSLELSDEVVENLISSWGKEAGDLEEKIVKDLGEFKQDGRLLDLLNKMAIFTPQLTPDVESSLIRTVYVRPDLFSKEGGFLRGSEFDRAFFLIRHLIDERMENTESEALLMKIIEATPSLELAIRLMDHCRKERPGLFKRLQETLSDRLTRHFIDGNRDIFEEEAEDFARILYQWAVIGEEEGKKVNDYVFCLTGKNPKYLGRIVDRYVDRWPHERLTINWDLDKLLEENRLYKQVKENYSNAFSDEREKSALDLFMRAYEVQRESEET